MNCRTAEGMLNRYITHTLSVKELEDFLNHIRTCSSCYDELETYFIVHKAMQQLDIDEDGEEETILDFKELLEMDIKRSRRFIYKMKLRHFLSGFGICLLIVLLAAFLLFVAMQVVF